MTIRRPHRITALVLVLALVAAAPNPAEACVAAFGYTGTGTDNAAFIHANLPNVTTGYLVAPANPSHSLVSDVAQIVPQTGPVFINLKEVIFNPFPRPVADCTHYERGPATTTKKFYEIRGNYQARLNQWFAANQDLFELLNGKRQVYGLVLHDEANNDCVENWVLHLAATHTRQLIDQYTEYGPIYVTISLGLRNIPDGPKSNGFLLKPSGGIGKFTPYIDLIGYSAYDIFNPANDSHPYNLNAETWSALSAKLDQMLQANQKTAVVVKGFCSPWDVNHPDPPPPGDDPTEYYWGEIYCPPLAKDWWKIGLLATHWADYLANDSRNLFMLAFHWRTVDPAGFSGVETLGTEVWNFHSQITPNCTVPTTLQ